MNWKRRGKPAPNSKSQTTTIDGETWSKLEQKRAESPTRREAITEESSEDHSTRAAQVARDEQLAREIHYDEVQRTGTPEPEKPGLKQAAPSYRPDITGKPTYQQVVADSLERADKPAKARREIGNSFVSKSKAQRRRRPAPSSSEPGRLDDILDSLQSDSESSAGGRANSVQPAAPAAPIQPVQTTHTIALRDQKDQATLYSQAASNSFTKFPSWKGDTVTFLEKIERCFL